MKAEQDEGAEMTPELEKVEVVPGAYQVSVSALMETDERKKQKQGVLKPEDSADLSTTSKGSVLEGARTSGDYSSFANQIV